MESEPEESQGKVHFPEDQLMQHDSEIIVKREREDRIAVHLGFLQIKHHYEVRFSVKDDMNEDLNFDPLENLHVRFLDVRPSEDGRIFLEEEGPMAIWGVLVGNNDNDEEDFHELTMEEVKKGEGHDLTLSFHAHKEKLLRENVTLTDSNDSSRLLMVVLHARVLGKGKGTPALKSGIHCTGIDADYDSEQSDWQGFD